MRKYEFVFLTRTDLEKKKKEETFKALEEQFSKIGAKVSKKEDLGEKDLTYPVGDSNRASFYSWWLEFSGNEVNFSSISLFLGRQSDIVRYLVLKPRKGRENGK